MMGTSIYQVFLRFLLLSCLTTGSHVRAQTGQELATIYQDTLTLFEVFPPIDPEPEIWIQDENYSLEPIDVILGTTILSIDEISPGDSRFTTTLRTVTYWKKSACDQTLTHQAACDSTVNQLRFVSANNIVGSPTLSLRLNVEDIHQAVFDANNQTDLQPDAELVESQATIVQTFDMRYYPFEVHGLEISATSLYSTKVVNLTAVPKSSFTAPRLPAGWEYIGTECSTFIAGNDDNVQNRRAQDGEVPIEFATYKCVVWVSRNNPGWWTTSFFLHCGITTIAFAGTVGMMSNSVAEARDDRDAARRALFDGTRLIGTYTMGLLLTYVFQVETSPYGQPVEFWPRVPASTMIYSLGMATIFIQAFSGLLGSFLFKRPLLSEGFIGAPYQTYDFENIPKEGEVGEDRSPLILRKYDPKPEQSYDEALHADADETKDATTDTPESAAAEDAHVPIPRIRRNNTKGYNVLSLREARLIQIFVRNIFFFKVVLLSVSFLCALIILVSARRQRDKAIDDVLTFVS